MYTCVWCGDSPVQTDSKGHCAQCAEYRRYIKW